MKNIAQNVKLIALAVILSFGISFASAWVLPTAAPPNGNADAPLTTGSVQQTKKGNLVIDSGDTSKPAVLVTTGLVVPGGALGQVLTFVAPTQNAKGEYTSSGVGWTTPSVGGGTPPSPPVSIDTFYSDLASVAWGESTTLRWTSTNADLCVASGGESLSWSGPQELSGSLPLGTLTTSATYTLTCTRGAGTEPTDIDIDVINITVAPFVSPPPVPTVTSFTASSNPVSLGGSTVLSWTSTDATSCTTSGAWAGTTIDTAGNQTISNITTSPRDYTITCNGVGGASVPKTVTVTISAPTASLSYKNAGKLTTKYYATLTWSSANATSCAASGGWAGGKGLSGQQGVTGISSPTSFSLTCSGPGGTSAPSSVMIPPLVNFSINRPAKTVTWSTVGAVSCAASGNWSGAKALSGTQAVSFSTVSLSGIAIFNLTCKGFPSIETVETVTSK
ncbi:MAG: hypothetical protein AAB552_02205 [Patescibacteria group bacterium]